MVHESKKLLRLKFWVGIIIILSSGTLNDILAQTYTSNSNGNWDNAGTWTISNSAGCGTPIPTTPPAQTNNRTCSIIVIINHNVTAPNDLTIGNNNQVFIQIAANRTLTIPRDLSITGFNNKSLTISGSGILEIGDDLNISGNSNISISGDLTINVDDRIEITQAAQFEADGNIQFTADRITIDGNGSLNFTALTNARFESTGNNRDFIIRNGSNVTFSGTSGIVSNRDIIIDGNTPRIIFEDNSFMISDRNLLLSNGGTLQLNGVSNLTIGRDLEISDQFNLELSDDSGVRVERDLLMQNGSQIILNNNAGLIVEDDLQMENQSTIILNNDAKITVTDNTSLENQARILGNDNSQLVLEGELSLDDQSTVLLDNSSSILVEQSVEVTTNNSANGLRFIGNSIGTFNSNVTIDGNGSMLFLDDNGSVVFNNTVDIEAGANVSLAGNSNVTLLGDLNFDNNNGTTWTNAESSTVLIEGNFSKGANSNLAIRDSAIFEICTGTFPLAILDPRINVASLPAYYGGCRVLPVDYAYFNSEYNSIWRSSDLAWATSKEWENSHFDVERAINTVTSWEKIGEIKGQGYSDGLVEYDFRDSNLPIAGGDIFYRLKQIDFDGDYSYSETRAIQVNPIFSNTFWKVFPNPTQANQIRIEILDPSNYSDELIFLRIISPTGKVETLEIANINRLSNEVQQTFSRKPKGVYTIEIAWGINREYHKVILKR